jgi:hypothetical protein
MFVTVPVIRNHWHDMHDTSHASQLHPALSGIPCVISIDSIAQLCQALAEYIVMLPLSRVFPSDLWKHYISHNSHTRLDSARFDVPFSPISFVLQWSRNITATASGGTPASEHLQLPDVFYLFIRLT